MLAEIIMLGAFGVAALLFVVFFVIPALPILWFRGVKFTAGILAGVFKFIVVLPIVIAILIAAGMI